MVKQGHAASDAAASACTIRSSEVVMRQINY